METEESQNLSRRERRKIFHEEKKIEEKKSGFNKKLRKWGIVVLILAVIGGGGYWFFKDATKPLAGMAVADLGRGHVPDGEKLEFNSNPPTSGKHYDGPSRAGIYEKPVSDGHLVHSLEHGYVIMSYNCTKKISNFTLPAGRQEFQNLNVYAHEEELPQTDTNQSQDETLEGEEWNSQECKDLVAKLTSIYEKKGKWKLIVIPRPTLDSRIALTAWTRIDKFNDFNENKITDFIDAFLNRGPEKTID